jgi:outer membrane protein assembly factor BamD (BamD/ComL family)
MKLKMVSPLLLVVGVFLIAGCGKKKGEKEYFELAYQQMEKEQWSESEKYFQKIVDDYPEGDYSAKALFMVGFVNANYLKNYERAEKYYKEFLSKYPDNELADDAQYELDHLGKDINDLPFLKGETSEGDSVVVESARKVKSQS